MAELDTTEAPVPTTIEVDRHRLKALEDRSREYSVTIKVLAVVAERLLAAIGGESLVITDEAYQKSPDLKAWRDVPKGQVVVTISR